jgi:hypothetical protein
MTTIIASGEDTAEARRLAGIASQAAADAALSAALAQAARDATLAAPGASNTFSTKAEADTNIGSVAADAYVQVLVDETRGDAWTVYRKVSGAYVYQTTTTTGGTTTSTGASQAGLLAKLNGNGALDRTLLAPDGFQKAKFIILSDTGSIGDLGDFSGTLLGSLHRVHGTDQSKVGSEYVKWGNDSKSSRIVFAKSRGAEANFASLNASDRVAIFDFQGAGIGSQFGHVANFTVEVDGTPATAGELHGAISFLTGTGGANGLRTAVKLNALQQAYFPGKNTVPASLPAAGSDYGAIVRVAAGSADQAAMRFDLTGVALRTSPLAGCLEVDANGKIYMTDVNSKRDALLVGQVKVDGDSGAIAAGAAAGTSPTISVEWGDGCATVTLTTGTSPTTGDLFTLTFPHGFASRSFPFLQGGNDVAATYVGRNLGAVQSASNVVVRAPATAPAATTEYIIHMIFLGK